jgi:[acyl-carrier-protein] S-malonyltransferase
MKLAALFPGQGSQAVGMGRDLAERWAAAREVFEAADRTLGVALSALCWQGPEETLRLTENTQPALLAHSIAAWRVLVAAGIRVDPSPATAWASTRRWSRRRAASRTRSPRCGCAAASTEAVPVGAGAMAAVLGLDDELVVAC